MAGSGKPCTGYTWDTHEVNYCGVAWAATLAPIGSSCPLTHHEQCVLEQLLPVNVGQVHLHTPGQLRRKVLHVGFPVQ